MDIELYRAAVRGDSSILQKGSVNSEYFLQRSVEAENNIIHVAVRGEHEDFTREAVMRFPELICQTNSYGETPFHIAAETGNVNILDLLLSYYKAIEQPAEMKNNKNIIDSWKVKNSEGNTPLHVAIIHAKLQFAVVLVSEDPELAAIANKFGETPLHLAIKHRVDGDKKSVLIAMQKVVNVLSEGGKFIVPIPEKEDSERIITLLLEKKSFVACLRDSDGLTPLFRATSVNTTATVLPYISAVKSIINYCPQSVEVCDFSGKTILHLLCELPWHDVVFHEWLLSLPEIHGLKNHQDFAGDTPAHKAVKNANSFMVQQLLFRLSSNFAIKNKVGVSAADLLKQQSAKFDDLSIIKRMDLATPSTATEGSVEMLNNFLHELPRLEGRVDPREDICRGAGNVLHWLITPGNWTRSYWGDHRFQEFIKRVLDRYPVLICETDEFGDTPLHSLAELNPWFSDISVLRMFDHYYRKLQKETDTDDELYLPPWRMKNHEGNTPLHETILSFPFSTARVSDFLMFDPELAEYQNENMDSPLHLLSDVNDEFDENSGRDLQKNLKSKLSVKAFECRDKHDLRPVLKAAARNSLHLVKTLYNLLVDLDPDITFPSMRTKDGKTYLHLLASQAPSIETETYKRVLGRGIRMQLLQSKVDDDGNTPLHLAIERGNFEFAHFAIESTDRMDNLLYKRNKKGLTPADLIGSAEHIPRKFENFLWSNPTLVKDMLGVRSLSGVPTTRINEYTNTLGVIAALLATITFTAVFTVPGGLDSNNGTPLLMKHMAFQVFMVSDILAMCLSMMVLFCLLWIMTMGNKKDSVVVLDLTIFLLQLSFYATLLAFMTGLYVTVNPSVSWIAILGCALCSSLILLMHKSLIALCIPYFISIFSISRRVTLLFKEFLYLILCGVPKKAMACCSDQNHEGGGRTGTGHEVSHGHGNSDQPDRQAAEAPEPLWTAAYSD